MYIANAEVHPQLVQIQVASKPLKHCKQQQRQSATQINFRIIAKC